MEVRKLTNQEHSHHLKQLAPSLVPGDLFAIGNLDLLLRPCIGLCGSRDASSEALDWARRFGNEAAQRNIVVVSGYARGTDLEAHLGALEAGGCTIAVLPEGIQYFRVRREIKDIIDPQRNFLAISMFDQKARWTVWRAMERNKLIVGLSAGLFVVEAREKGGTVAAAYEAMRQRKRLWAVAYSKTTTGRRGNKLLLAGKALPVNHLDDFRAALDEAMHEPPSEVRQLVMSVISEAEEGEQ